MSQQSFSLIIDFEATGIDPKEARPLEIAVMAVDSHTMVPVKSFSQVIYDKDYPEIPQAIHDLTGISMAELHQKGLHLDSAMLELQGMIQRLNGPVDYVIAYNKEYDETLLLAELDRKKFASPIHATPWLCAMKDVEPNLKLKCWKLSHLALDHGVAVDPTGLHRAMADVSLTQEFLSHIKYSAHDMFKFNQIPWTVVQALIPEPWKDNGKGVELAKARGYRWEQADHSTKVPKSWVKKLKFDKLHLEIEAAPFKVRELAI